MRFQIYFGLVALFVLGCGVGDAEGENFGEFYNLFIFARPGCTNFQLKYFHFQIFFQ